MEGERFALCNWWSNVVIAVLIYYLFAIHNSIGFLRYYIFLSIKVNYAPCLVSLHEIMDKLFTQLPSKCLFVFFELFW